MNVRPLSVPGFEEVYELRFAGTAAFLAIAHAARGRAFGGIRIRSYEAESQALDDALALARAMARKVALAGIEGGGAKTVVIEPPAERRAEALAELGRFIESLGGKYKCGPDYGFTAADEAILRSVTSHVATGDLAAGTAESVARTMIAAAGRLERVVIQGFGSVGRLLAERLKREGATAVIAEVNPPVGLTDTFRAVSPDTVFDEPCDVFSPCALGGVLHERTIDRLRCRVVCGAANNPLASPADADRLQARGIVYVPDVLANAGATIVGASRALDEEREIPRRMDALVALTGDVLARAAAEGRSPHHVALQLADERIAALRGLPS